jgi:hypothetical protein
MMPRPGRAFRRVPIAVGQTGRAWPPGGHALGEARGARDCPGLVNEDQEGVVSVGVVGGYAPVDAQDHRPVPADNTSGAKRDRLTAELLATVG